ncbi:MAG: UDP-glucose/GDP-mannose dehydrogenase family protein [Burkholderiaceae bacterium]|uniref:UDP-glucose dehydrogenase family protein n=1 Tax=Polynucleobacter sp. HIN8 TaxID=3047867 RepID=UPI001D265A65|nr:UDP-glucose/GDP-mannose dehydrogenase family protein [Polynucleobacter sp. HIN8]NCX13839.1 UDP-glucose/GDP-mannose dehydrogenase family protein [Burkholderiaceae bacterium]NCZ79234.1 UDP-glucose/GDP-mannose dehydrogenase family protein [Burkholderiaceae bacterium]NDI19756.1 UDP-glucose/GDP-mannose dehydrogenase family protein [Burkholderiaceae bacterium]BEI38493.1 UDP-glucose/GDP-mannose dehydrogenase family protein [Polynucleobacter sp. HIN8]
MKVTIVGSGYVGLVTGACLAELGNAVFCLDLDQKKIDILNSGGVPIYEPGLQEMIARNRSAGRIQFSTDVAAAVEHGEIQFIAVGTPPDEDGSADLQYVIAAARNIGKYMNSSKVIVDKSTVPVGTAEKVTAAIVEELKKRNLDPAWCSVVSNPEFLKEGAAVEDFMRPDRIVIGTNHDAAGLRAKELMRKLYAPFNRHHERTYYMDVKSAELTKYAANAMLATRISFMNELANLADAVGADIEAVRQGIGSDSRIGYGFLYAGTGYGGSCFPKDVSALSKTALQHGRDLKILEAVEAVNREQKTILIEKITKRFGNDLSKHRFAMWGLAFKPNTDDMREAPSRFIIAELVKRGAQVVAHDPVAMTEAQHALELDFQTKPDELKRVSLVKTPEDALAGASALIIVTEWKAFRSPDFDHLKQAMQNPIIFDGRNLYEPQSMTELGFEYYGIGRHN